MNSRHGNEKQPGAPTKPETSSLGGLWGGQWLRRRDTRWLLVALALISLMPTNQSLWIDEGFSLAYADEPTVKALATRLVTSPGSEPLMPLGILSTWAGAKVFGRSESGLRRPNRLGSRNFHPRPGRHERIRLLAAHIRVSRRRYVDRAPIRRDVWQNGAHGRNTGHSQPGAQNPWGFRTEVHTRSRR